MGRREFLRVMASSLAMAGASGCTKQPRQEIVPYVRQPEDLIPGTARWFATAMDIGGDAQGLLVCSHDGRPTKIEGNPDHPQTLGRSSVLMQAALLDLYDPDRSQFGRKRGATSIWEEFEAALLAEIPRWKQSGGSGIRLLTGLRSSPTLQQQIDEFLQRYPNARWHGHDAAFPPPPVGVTCDHARARVILSLDDDFLGATDAAPKTILEFTKDRGTGSQDKRLYVVESMPSLTGAMADHRLALPPSQFEAFASELLGAVRGSTTPTRAWIAAVAADLTRHRGASAVLAGRYQAEAVHSLARALNDALGNTGVTIRHAASVKHAPSGLAELTDEMHRGDIGTLIVMGVNPSFTGAPDLRFDEALKKVPFTLHLGTYWDETAAQCLWHIPESHFLEAWSDARASDGTLSIVQPLIEPLYPTRSAHELFAALLESVPESGHEVVRESWRKRHPGTDEDASWKKVLHDGVAAIAAVPDSNPNEPPPTAAPAPAHPPDAQTEDALELIIRPDSHLLDGRHANNAWLQELPRPITKLTWGNAAHLSPRTAARLHLSQGDVVNLQYEQAKIDAPVLIVPGHADDCVTVHLGYGRTKAGRVGDGVGFNAAILQTRNAPWGGPGLKMEKTGRTSTFATTQEHQSMEGREPVRVVRADSMDASLHHETPAADVSLYPPVEYQRPAWGMVIDLARCIGCGTCTIACQAENNIPVVGREQVMRGREMHWIRLDRYFSGPPDAPEIHHQPVPCMHCENAPCEVVCPVAATVHDHQGLNLMVYNRCIGTRYCSNNCPYKVRRFNFLQYTDRRTPQLKLMRNPEVTVRMRGVMEKCTYCVQRIATVRITADKENRAIRDGEVVPACAQACPADAIMFGDILDKESRVARERMSPRHYDLLGEMNTRPRTTYLAKVRRANPEMPS
jgi:molybdopterin-containing oxidoreductase family iron-sulfur binding subunit